MHGIVSLLGDQYCKVVEDIWQELNQDCDVIGIEVTPYPHFSWMIAEGFNQGAMTEAVTRLAEETKPFEVNTAGIALFTGDAPVIHIPLTRTAELSTRHAKVWRMLSPHFTGVSLLYHPDSWMPHITLAHSDVTPMNLDCVMQKLSFRSFDWKLTVDAFTFVSQSVGEVGSIQFTIPFGG
jgi:2'-5' RNA ligase